METASGNLPPPATRQPFIMRITYVLTLLEIHSTLHMLTLNQVITFSRLALHLKSDILLPQPSQQTDPTVAPSIDHSGEKRNDGGKGTAASHGHIQVTFSIWVVNTSSVVPCA
jgi:hypothetical protein